MSELEVADAGVKAASGAVTTETPSARDVIHPELRDRLSVSGPEELHHVVVAVKERAPFRRLTPLVPGEDRQGAINRERLAARLREFDQQKAERVAVMAPHADRVLAHGGVVEQYLALCHCFLARAPARAIEELSESPEVVALEPADLKGELCVQLVTARDQIGSDPFFFFGIDGAGPGYFVGLIDTGISTSPTVLNSPTHVDFQRDCVYGVRGASTRGIPIGTRLTRWATARESRMSSRGTRTLGSSIGA